MTVQRISLLLPVKSMSAAVEFWKRVLGVDPTFVDGEKWAQFDVESGRISLAGEDRVTDVPGPMIKVDDLSAALRRAEDGGYEAGPIEQGAHEIRSVVRDPEGWPVVMYQTTA